MSDLLQRLQGAVGDAYRIERELPGGGMSRLFYAIEASLDREVVIKLLPPEWASDVSAERFRQEIQLAAHLQHPNVLPVLTAGASGDLVYYVMPYVRGESLRHRLVKDGKLPVPDALRILHEVADALAYAHSNGVVHRDIKPENILLQEGHAVLTDFGVARAVAAARSGGRLTGTGVALGTPGYMSPEQVAGEGDIDARADVYALAVVGYEMLSGRPPFTGSTAQAVIAAHLTETPEPIERLRPDTPRPVATTITQALVKSPQERLQSAAAFRDGVAAYDGGAARASRHRGGLVAGAVIAVLAAAVALFWPRGYHVEGDPRHSLVVFPFENRTGDAEYDWLEDAAMNSMGLTMAHWQDLRVYDDERTESLLRRAGIADASSLDFAAAQRLAREARVGTLILGDVRREGDELVFEAKVHDVASGERLSTEIVRTPLTGDPRPAFDSLSARILRVSGAEPGERPGVVAQTTRSLDAYRAYLRGSAFLQQLEPDSAAHYLNRAIALDSTFALAYLQLRNAEGWKEVTGGDPARTRPLVAKAELYGADLPRRLRSLIQFYVAWEAGRLGQARAIAEGLIARDSSDVEAWYQLGEATFHDGATLFPHPDTLGNLGEALAAFQRVLALDSSYTLAYRHTADALEQCARPGMPWVCLADSAAYGWPPEDLERRYGEERIRAARERARTELVTTIRAWTAATPASESVRERAIQILVGQEMFDEAGRQLQALRELAGRLTPREEAAQAQILMAQKHYAEAADTFARALAGVRDSTELLTGSFYTLAFFPTNALSPAGRIDEFETAAVTIGDAVPAGTPAGAGFTVGEVRGLQRFQLAALAAGLRPGTPDSVLRSYHHAANDSIRRLAGGDSVRAQELISRMPTILMNSFSLLAVRLDTTFTIVAGVKRSDFAPEIGAVFHAVGVLQRGDTATARRLADEAFPSLRHVPAVWMDFYLLYVWGRLFAALENPRRAVEAFALLDSATNAVRIDDFLVRSWGERAPLYAELGDTVRAIEMYEKFADAWRNADPELQPMVERARRAAAALKGGADSAQSGRLPSRR